MEVYEEMLNSVLYSELRTLPVPEGPDVQSQKMVVAVAAVLARLGEIVADALDEDPSDRLRVREKYYADLISENVRLKAQVTQLQGSNNVEVTKRRAANRLLEWLYTNENLSLAAQQKIAASLSRVCE